MANTAGGTLREKLDRFWAALFLTEEGRPKSATLLYSFCLSLLFVGVYAIAYGFLIDRLELAFAAQSVAVRNALQSVLPGLTGSAVCCATWFLFKDRRLVPAAYLWLIVYALAALVAMAFITSGEEYRIFLYFFALLVPTGLVSGAAASFLLYRQFRRREARTK